MHSLTKVILLGLAQALAVLSQQPSPLSVALPNPTVCGDIVKHTGTPVFDSSFVLACLTSVPFNAAVGSRLIRYLNDTLQFYSTLAYLADPPAGYQQPAVDLVAGLVELQHTIDGGGFENEYDFENAIQRLLQAAHDDHLALVGGVLSPFAFGSPYAIASVSLDGRELPKVYVAADLFANQTNNLAWAVSPISTINGQDVVDFLTEFAAANSVGKLEPHADWNMLMQSGALDVQGYFEVFYGAATFYPGNTLILGFENGSYTEPQTWDGLYYSPGDTGPLETGGDFYNFFMLGLYPESYVANASTEVDDLVQSDDAPCPTAIPEPGELLGAYPAAAGVVPAASCTNDQGSVRGYFLNESSLAVLSIPAFVSYGEEGTRFPDTVRDFLRRSRRAGLRKVVIDLQQNSGGQSLLAIDIFKLFFPAVDPFAASRRRASPWADVLGSAFTEYWQHLGDDETLWYTLLTNEWVAASRLDAESGEYYNSWEEYFGPAGTYNGDAFTNLERYNLSDNIFSEEAAGIDIDDSSSSPELYDAQDIIMLTDGLCSSSCALFIEMMHQTGVRTVVAGGQPHYGPMQGAAGTRGAAAYTAQQLDEDIEGTQYIRNVSTPGEVGLPDRSLGLYLPFLGVNLRDQIHEHDPEHVPLQFQYQPAECRIFYTPKTWYNYTALWIHAADAIWSSPGLCIANSTSDKPLRPPLPLPLRPQRLKPSYRRHPATSNQHPTTPPTIPPTTYLPRRQD
ncbi:hypothetical protein ASPCAL09657 [Aspergillus calidoustus]|uniref:Uncharacterized protein n=1 Tax=Aspergillus calidoustus TaxID=454130 RepID=A0A0U5G445_ASPCI|nr:hypothetical protein ASPCAL09657 [Aspergillus calidoustus]